MTKQQRSVMHTTVLSACLSSRPACPHLGIAPRLFTPVVPLLVFFH